MVGSGARGIPDELARQRQLHRQIDFVAHDDPLLVRELGQVIFVLGRVRFGNIEHMQYQIRLRHGFPAAADALLLEAVARLAQSRCVHKHDRNPANVRRLLDRVSRCAGDG